jgi:Mg2+ and Co2+ transporter CorA
MGRDKVRSKGVKGRPTLSRIETPQSKFNAFIIGSGDLELCDVEDAINNHGEGSYWIDASVYGDADASELYSLIDQLDLSPFLRRHLDQAEQLQTSQVLTLSASALIVLRVLTFDDRSKEVRHAVALCLKGLLLTVTMCAGDAKAVAPVQVMSRKTMDYMKTMELPQASTTGALSMWMMCHVNRVAQVLNNLRMRVFDLNEMMEKSVASVDLAEISNVKDELLRVLAVAEEQSNCVQSIADGESITSSIDFSALRGSLSTLVSTAGSTERMALRLEKRVSDLRAAYDAHQQDRINHRLSVLTVFSAVFLPITLMAGIWGMNFVNIPSLENENGFYFALMSMALVAIGMLLSFYFFGWFN